MLLKFVSIHPRVIQIVVQLEFACFCGQLENRGHITWASFFKCFYCHRLQLKINVLEKKSKHRITEINQM